MDLNSEEILDLLTPGNLQSKDVQIDFVNKKVYVTAIRENIGVLRQYMTTQGFDYVGETVKVQYNENCCDCGSSFDFDAPNADPVQCFGLSTSDTSSSNNEDNCSPFVTLQKYVYSSPLTKCFVDNLVLNLDPGCGCDSGNCSWRTEISPSWFQVTDLNTSLVYNKLIGGFYQLSVENNNYVLRELEEETYYPSISAAPTSFTQIPLNECPCLLETRNNSKFLKINVLSDRYEDFDSVIEKWIYAEETAYTFMKLTGALNICASNKNTINPNGTYVEDPVLITQWMNELDASSTVQTEMFEDSCDFLFPISGMALWLDGQDSLNGFQTIGSTITSWTDKSTHNNTGESIGAPELVEENGIKYATGFNSSTYFDCGNSIILTENNGYTVFAVAKISTHSIYAQLVSCQGASTDEGAMLLAIGQSNFSNESYFLAGHTNNGQTEAISNNATPLNQNVVLAGRLTAGGVTLSIQQSGDTRVDVAYGISSGSTAPSHLLVGAYAFNLSYYFNGDVAEVLVYNRALSDAEFLYNMNYLEAKYGVSP